MNIYVSNITLNNQKNIIGTNSQTISFYAELENLWKNWLWWKIDLKIAFFVLILLIFQGTEGHDRLELEQNKIDFSSGFNKFFYNYC